MLKGSSEKLLALIAMKTARLLMLRRSSNLVIGAKSHLSESRLFIHL